MDLPVLPLKLLNKFSQSPINISTFANNKNVVGKGYLINFNENDDASERYYVLYKDGIFDEYIKCKSIVD